MHVHCCRKYNIDGTGIFCCRIYLCMYLNAQCAQRQVSNTWVFLLDGI